MKQKAQKKYTKKELVRIITDICQYAIDNFPDPIMPIYGEIITTSHVISCFISQNTKFGDEGVESDVPLGRLEMDKHMGRKERKKLVENLIEAWNNPA
jgi:hypothetical protein